MPTSQEEARKIYELINEYIGPRVAQELTERLHKEVGAHTDNESLAISLAMLFELYK